MKEYCVSAVLESIFQRLLKCQKGKCVKIFWGFILTSLREGKFKHGIFWKRKKGQEPLPGWVLIVRKSRDVISFFTALLVVCLLTI